MNKREQMVEEIKKHYRLDSPEVFSAMLQVPRDKFVAKKYCDIAYKDSPVPTEQGQTMSQPYTIAFMTDLLLSSGSSLSLRKKSKSLATNSKNWKVLEVGTGSGYQAAILSKLVKEVYTIEIIKDLAEKAEKRLKKLGYKNVHVKSGSGERGWGEHAPYDATLVTAAIEKKVPQVLFGQLKDGGILVAPIGKGADKQMTKFTKLKNGKTKRQKYGIFHFVPFVSEPN